MACRIRQQLSLTLLVMKLLELVELLLSGLGEHIDHRLDFLCNFCRILEDWSIRLSSQVQHLLKLLWSSVMIWSRLFDRSALVPERTTSICMRRLCLLASHMFCVYIEIRSFRKTSRFDTCSVRRLLGWPFILLDYMHGKLVDLRDLRMKRLPLLLFELVEIHGCHTSLGNILLIVILSSSMLSPLVVRNCRFRLLQGT